MFDLLNSIYRKKTIDKHTNVGYNLTLNKLLASNPADALIVKDLLQYMFFVSPQHYFYLLYFCIPYRYNYPRVKMPKKTVVDDSELIAKICTVLNWSDRDVRLNRSIIDKVILSNFDYWKVELGVKK